jgi:dolichol-phosphate mannosyltransferase
VPNQPRPHLSVVIPLFRCAACVAETHRQLCAALEPHTPAFEIVFVNDASPENDWEIVAGLAAHDRRVKGVNLSRNFGQHFAITAGLDVADGDWVVVMDGDLQDSPAEIPNLYRKAQEGFDVVFARRVNRQDPFQKVLYSRLFGWIYNALSETPHDPLASNFSICSRAVVENYRRLRERSRAFGLIVRWLGFRTATIETPHRPRFAGESAYSFGKALALAVDALVSQSSKPLRLSIKLGMFIAFCAAAYGCVLILLKLFLGIPVAGWTTVVVSLYFVGGLILANLGVIGLYLGKLYDESKNRPLYVVRETLNIAAAADPASGPPRGKVE